MAKAIAQESPSVEDLKRVVNQIDSLSSHGFSEIAAIAKMALVWLESPRTCKNTEVIAVALNAIWNKADDIENSISYEADQVDCASTNEAFKRRCEARGFREKQGAAACSI